MWQTNDNVNTKGLPTDQEFLEWLMTDAEEAHKPVNLNTAAEAHADAAIKGGWRDEDQRTGEELIYREGNTPIKLLQGTVARVVVRTALDCLSSEREALKRVPVGILPSTDVNAFAIRTPRRGAVIALNVALLHHFKILLYSSLALIHVDDHSTFNRSHPSEEYEQSIIRLAKVVCSGDTINWDEFHIRDCFIGAQPNRLVTTSMLFVAVFVLLHEYGHVQLGHLDANAVRQIAIGSTEVDVYLNSHNQEYDADNFALVRFRKLLHDHEAAMSIVGILFRFFDLCERMAGVTVSGTHPPALQRWQRIKNICEEDQGNGGTIGAIDALFDGLSPHGTKRDKGEPPG